MIEWHGWSCDPDRSEALHIGPLPGRKSICLYSMVGSVMSVHAYFRSVGEARAALAILDRLLDPSGTSA